MADESIEVWENFRDFHIQHARTRYGISASQRYRASSRQDVFRKMSDGVRVPQASRAVNH